MKIEVTNDNVIFKSLLFNVVVPKENNDIQYSIYDPSEFLIPTVFLLVVPNTYKTSCIGYVLMFLNWLFGPKQRRIVNPFFVQTVEDIKSGRGIFNAELKQFRSSLIAKLLNIEGKGNIITFLDDLKNHGWDIQKPQQVFNEWLNKTVDPKFIPRTPERKNDRKALMIVIFIFFEIMYSAIFFLGSKNIIKDIPVYLLITGIIAVFCSGFYLLIRKK